MIVSPATNKTKKWLLLQTKFDIKTALICSILKLHNTQSKNRFEITNSRLQIHFQGKVQLSRTFYSALQEWPMKRAKFV